MFDSLSGISRCLSYGSLLLLIIWSRFFERTETVIMFRVHPVHFPVSHGGGLQLFQQKEKEILH